MIDGVIIMIIGCVAIGGFIGMYLTAKMVKKDRELEQIKIKKEYKEKHKQKILKRQQEKNNIV